MERKQGILVSDSRTESIVHYNASNYKGLSAVLAQDSDRFNEVLADQSIHLYGIFLGIDGPSVDSLRLLSCCHNQRPGVPIYLVDQGHILSGLKIKEDDLKKVGVKKVLDDYHDFKVLVNLVNPMDQDFDKETALAVAKMNPDVDGSVSTDSEDQFVPISARNFLSGTESIFDLYVRLSPSKHIKILSAGSTISLDRIVKYLNKGLQHFYLRKEAQKVYLDYCGHLAARIITQQKVSDSSKVKINMGFGSQVDYLIENMSLTTEQIDYSKTFIENVNGLVKSMNLKKSKAMVHFLSDIKAYGHGSAVTFVAALLARELGFEGDSSVKKVGLAAMFHDLGMKLIPEELSEKHETDMSLKEKSLYRTHPKIGAEELARVEDVHDSVLQAIMHHHVRKNSLGFPVDVPFARIGMLAQIVGLADEIVHANMEESRLNMRPLVYINDVVLSNFSSQISKAFLQVFRAF